MEACVCAVWAYIQRSAADRLVVTAVFGQNRTKAKKAPDHERRFPRQRLARRRACVLSEVEICDSRSRALPDTCPLASVSACRAGGGARPVPLEPCLDENLSTESVSQKQVEFSQWYIVLQHLFG